MGLDMELLRYFPPAGAATWLDAVTADLKGRAVEETITWSPATGVAVRALYPAADLPPDGAPLRYPAATGWAACAWIGRTADANFQPRMNAAVDGGADAFACDSTGSNWPASPLPVFLFASHPFSERSVPASASGAYLWRPESRPASMNALVEACWPAANLLRTTAPGVRSLGVDLVHFSGASLPVQLALTLAIVNRHIERGLTTGWHLSEILAGLQFTIPVGRLFFPELARLRALPRLVGYMALVYDPGLRAIPRLAILTETERCSGDDPHTHALRTTPMALAAILGGSAALLVHPGGDTPAWDRLALNTHHVLRHEAYLGHVADPAAGASYIEHLTDALARRAWRLFQILESTPDPDVSIDALHTLDAAT
jgi:Methylmalonyl-CoA mutase